MQTRGGGPSYEQSRQAGRPVDETPSEPHFPFTKHGKSSMPEYFVYRSLLARCYSPKSEHWAAYGGRGISVCEQWRHSFDAFLADVGERASRQHTIERIDVDGDYEPTNVKWATTTEQANNRRRTRKLEAHGRSLSPAEWARELGISRRAMQHRLKAGWSIERMLSGPERRRASGSAR